MLWWGVKCLGKMFLNAEALKTAATSHSACVKNLRPGSHFHKQEYYEFVQLAVLYLKHCLICLQSSWWFTYYIWWYSSPLISSYLKERIIPLLVLTAFDPPFNPVLGNCPKYFSYWRPSFPDFPLLISNCIFPSREKESYCIWNYWSINFNNKPKQAKV